MHHVRLAPVAPSVHRRRLRIAGAGAVLMALSACGEPPTSGAQFCAALQERMPVLAGRVRTSEDVEALVTAYTELGERTPLAIEEPWGRLVSLVDTAATVAPDDPASVQTAADAAYAAERSAREVAEWVQATCGFSMPAMSGVEGPVAPPPATQPATTLPATTLPATTPPATNEPVTTSG